MMEFEYFNFGVLELIIDKGMQSVVVYFHILIKVFRNDLSFGMLELHKSLNISISALFMVGSFY